ncbi:hybrid sensor histidine kinase/response regulator [Pontixanthobacter sp. CEM42]|uniref:ATP-binding response regulator n=1 Tax=Pontixanthobacter sp. CEM42 TaxID=2792077 RepID=UPI001ADEE4D3|nr:hybrid sensor histidine kinase/response regulator [Pontixanthobacter sp. CEM42]
MDQPELLESEDLALLRMEQARLLKERAWGSSVLVEFIVVYTAVIMALVNSRVIAAVWFALGTTMVVVAYFFGKFAAREGITKENVSGFLRGHRIVSAVTGLVWGGFAIYQIDYASELTIFLGCLTVFSITIGGLLPSSAYRATYIALASTSLPPLGFYIAFTAPGGLALLGMGVIVYYLFAMFISARVEIDTRETIAARNARTLNEKIVTQNRLYLQASEEKSRFLAATSHDLSQPLQSQGFFMKALRDMLETQSQHDMLDKVEESWRAQKDLLQGIVDVSRIDSGAIVPRIVPVKLAEECHKLVDEFTSNERSPPLDKVQFDDVEVETDPLLLARILRNLLSNARKFTPQDGHVSFYAERVGQIARITISDSGQGISQEDQDRIFDEYVRVGGEGATPGLGLGLSIVQRLCELLDIGIDLRSAPGEGTTFYLSVPLAGAKAEGPAAIANDGDPFDGAPLVVLVDDEPAVTEAMAAVLTSWKCQVISASSSKQALEIVALTESDPALLLIDKRLGPDDDGVDLIAAIREECNAQIPAILMSGNLGNLAGYNEGDAIIYLNKPIEPGDLQVAMQDMLQNAHPANA